MPHKRSNRKAIVSLNQFASTEPMTSRITKHLLLRDLGDAMEPIADCIFGPCVTSAIPKELSFITFYSLQVLVVLLFNKRASQ